MKAQDKVSEFFDQHDLEGDAEFRILDLIAEVGEIAADATKSADYGQKRENLSVKEDEIGDALFSLLAVADKLGVDAEQALEKSLSKYRSRIEDTGDPGSN